MPRYRFFCKKCNRYDVRKMGVDEIHDGIWILCIVCGGTMKRSYGALPPPSVLEMGSEYHNIKMKKDINEDLKRRSKQDSLDNIGKMAEQHGVKALPKSLIGPN